MAQFLHGYSLQSKPGTHTIVESRHEGSAAVVASPFRCSGRAASSHQSGLARMPCRKAPAPTAPFSCPIFPVRHCPAVFAMVGSGTYTHRARDPAAAGLAPNSRDFCRRPHGVGQLHSGGRESSRQFRLPGALPNRPGFRYDMGLLAIAPGWWVGGRWAAPRHGNRRPDHDPGAGGVPARRATPSDSARTHRPASKYVFSPCSSHSKVIWNRHSGRSAGAVV